MTPIARGTRVLNRRRRDVIGLVLAVTDRDGQPVARIWWDSHRESTCRVAALVAIEDAGELPYDWKEQPL